MNSHSHQLAAIMFTDISGYTAMMGRDEEKAFQLLKKNREIHKPLIEKYQGKWIKEMGDGVLAQFDSAYNATRCAVEIQQKAKREFKGELRIGLHIGEIIVENNDIFGDGVNVASRIESIADPGGIYISEAIEKALQNRTDIKTNYLGEVSLKNVDEPVKIFYLVGENLKIPSRQKIKQLKGSIEKKSFKQKRFFRNPLFYSLLVILLILLLTINYWYNYQPERKVESIAILPFTNLTGNDDEQSMVDMMHDAVISEISKIGELIVISKTSTLQFRDTKLTIPEIAKILNVDAIMESSVQKTGDSIYMQVQLIQARPEEDHIWAQEYKRDARYILSLYGDLAKSVANEVKIQLTPQEENNLTHPDEVDPEVYKLYLQGQYNLLTLSKDAIEKSKEYFELVLEFEPDHALAHAGLCMFYVGYAQQGHISFFEAGPLADYHANRALEENSMLPEVFHAAAWNAWMQWKLDEYLDFFNRALELNRNFSEVLAFMGQALVIENLPEEAINKVRYAVELDPLNDTYKALYGMCLYFTHNYDEALQFLLEVHKKNPEHPMLNSSLRAVYHQKKMYLDEFESWVNKYSMSGDTIAVQELKAGYEKGGYEMALQNLTEHLIRKFNYSPEFVSAWQIATLYTRIGKKQEALIWLEKAYDVHSISLPFILIDPLFDYLRDDPRFKEIVRKMKAPA